MLFSTNQAESLDKFLRQCQPSTLKERLKARIRVDTTCNGGFISKELSWRYMEISSCVIL